MADGLPTLCIELDARVMDSAEAVLTWTRMLGRYADGGKTPAGLRVRLKVAEEYAFLTIKLAMLPSEALACIGSTPGVMVCGIHSIAELNDDPMSMIRHNEQAAPERRSIQ